jgi:hypothetical protein
MQRNSAFNSIAICIAAGALSACAAAPDPKPEIETARTLVEQAEQAGAAEFAGRDFETAHDRLRLAEDADEAHHDVEAQRFADQAVVNAQLAMANTAAAKAERAAAESQQTIDALREEANRPDSMATTP